MDSLCGPSAPSVTTKGESSVQALTASTQTVQLSKASTKKKVPLNFRCLGSSKELHGKPIYCVAWSTDTYHDDGLDSNDVINDGDAADNEEMGSREHTKSEPRMLRCFATCGANQVTVYEAELLNAKQTRRSSGILLRQGYLDADEGETFYSCAFGGRCLGSPFGYSPAATAEPLVIDATKTQSSVGKKSPQEGHNKLDYPSLVETSSFDGPELLLVAGTRGIIKVIDLVRKVLLSTLSGHGDDIYDLKFNPINTWLLMSASKDESMRLWNVQTCTCLAIFAGHEGHRDSVLSVAWHSQGDRIVSAGMDTTVKLWNVNHIFPTNSTSSELRLANNDKPFRTIYEQMPYFSTNKIHTNYVDSVQFVGDLVLKGLSLFANRSSEEVELVGKM